MTDSLKNLQVKLKKLLAQKSALETEVKKKAADIEPTNFGLPDLLRPQEANEDDKQFKHRQNCELRDFIVEKIWIEKDGNRLKFVLIPQMVEYISDCFYLRVNQTILWKPRGCGGSLCGALIVWLVLVYHKMSFTVIAGSGEQSQIVFNYVTNYFKCFPTFKKALYTKEPTTTKITLKSGVKFQACTASEKAIRGKHTAGLAIDEAAQKQAGTDEILSAAMQGPMSEKIYLILLFSTMHLPTGLFPDCILPGEKIYTDQGLVPIEEVTTGHSVINHEGAFTKVSKTFTKHLEDTEQVTVVPRSYGKGFNVTAGHGVLTFDRKTEKTVWKKAGDLILDDWLAIPRLKQVETYPNEITVKRFVYNKKPNPYQETKIPLNDDFYRWLGYWLGDGSNSKRLITHSYGKYDNFESDYDGLVGTLFDRSITNSRNREHLGVVEKSFGHKGLISWLEDECRADNRSKILPTWLIERASDEELMNLMIGLFRSDGALLNYGMNFSNTSDSIIQGVLLSLGRLGIPYSLSTYNHVNNKRVIMGNTCNAKPNNSINVSSEEAVPLIERCYNKTLNLGPARLFEVYTDYIAVKIRRIDKKPYEGIVYDLTVPDGNSFMMLNGTAHNTWDYSEEKGFNRYKWTVIDCLERCSLPYDCLENCPLTTRVEVQNPDGTVKEIRYKGCQGKARHTSGFMPFEKVLKAKEMNRGTDIYETEFLCERPELSACIYSVGLVDEAIRSCPVDKGYPYLEHIDGDSMAIGIDWGIGQTFMVLLSKGEHAVKVLETVSMTNQLIEPVEKVMDGWLSRFMPGTERDRFGGATIPVYADASHPYNNGILSNKGYFMNPVKFNMFKDFGIANLTQYFNQRRIRIHPDNKLLIRQLKGYRRGKDGKPVKKNDHGCDSLLSFLDPKITVYTDNGYKKVGKLEVGDMVLTHKKRFRPVIATHFVPYEGEEYSVWIEKGPNKHQPMKTTAEHPYMTQRGWVRADELKVGDELSLLGVECDCGNSKGLTRKWCDACTGLRRNDRWRDPGEREEKERKMKSETLLEEYRTGKRDAATNADAATRKVRSSEFWRPDVYTDIERIVNGEFKIRGMSPIHNKRVSKYFGDFVFEDEKIIVECDGTYWHDKKEREDPGYDARRDLYLENLGWTVLRFSDIEIKKDVKSVVDKVCRVLNNHSGDYVFIPTKVTKIEHSKPKKKKTAYHFEVAEDESYIARGVVHHNCAMLEFVYSEHWDDSDGIIDNSITVTKIK